MINIIMLSGLIGFFIGALLFRNAVYANGAIDAYYYANDPFHPGGRRAGAIIFKSLRHMYPNVVDPNESSLLSDDINAPKRDAATLAFEMNYHDVCYHYGFYNPNMARDAHGRYKDGRTRAAYDLWCGRSNLPGIV